MRLDTERLLDAPLRRYDPTHTDSPYLPHLPKLP